MIAILGGISLVCALAYGLRFTHLSPSLLRTVLKTTSTASLALISILLDGPGLLTIALICGALGDAFLSLDKDRGFLPGLGSFLMGHAAFVALLWPLGGGWVAIVADPLRSLFTIALLIFGLATYSKLRPKLGPMNIPVAIYIVLIAGMGIAALTLPLTWPLRLAMGAAGLFILSDFILSQQLFVLDEGSPWHKPCSTILWFTYWPAQALFAAAFLLPS